VTFFGFAANYAVNYAVVFAAVSAEDPISGMSSLKGAFCQSFDRATTTADSFATHCNEKERFK
jgi:hypothetical protein